MLSVSGLHVAVLAEGVVLLLLVAGASTRRAELIATVTIAVFVLFVGAPSPAIRSAAMYAALVIARRLQRPTSPWALLALGAALPLIQPRVVNEIGYHLSVAGMAGLIASGKLSRRLPMDRIPEWGRRLARETMATVVASALTAPIVAWHFGRVSLAAPLTNLAAAPLFGLAQPRRFYRWHSAPARGGGADRGRDSGAPRRNREGWCDRRGDPRIGAGRAADRRDRAPARWSVGIVAGGVFRALLGKAGVAVGFSAGFRTLVAGASPGRIAPRGAHDRRWTG
jgi:ComEC/Rec2-related protein